MTALEAAIELRDNGPQWQSVGICSNLHGQHLDAFKAFEVFLCESGYNDCYPVEVNLMGMCPDDAEAYYMGCADMWVGAHGVARRQLLNEFINWLRSKK